MGPTKALPYPPCHIQQLHQAGFPAYAMPQSWPEPPGQAILAQGPAITASRDPARNAHEDLSKLRIAFEMFAKKKIDLLAEL